MKISIDSLLPNSDNHGLSSFSLNQNHQFNGNGFKSLEYDELINNNNWNNSSNNINGNVGGNSFGNHRVNSILPPPLSPTKFMNDDVIPPPEDFQLTNKTGSLNDYDESSFNYNANAMSFSPSNIGGKKNFSNLNSSGSALFPEDHFKSPSLLRTGASNSNSFISQSYSPTNFGSPFASMDHMNNSSMTPPLNQFKQSGNRPMPILSTPQSNSRSLNNFNSFSPSNGKPFYPNHQSHQTPPPQQQQQSMMGGGVSNLYSPSNLRSPSISNISSAGTGGSNAQGRAINKMLLEILRERVIDPQRLDLAVETYTERMDCVNLATLLFHTGKKRLLLSPGYIRRIAARMNILKEELRAREASNALYGLKCMSSDIPEVRELVTALATKVANSSSEFVAQAVGNALYGCQMMTSDHDEVRYLLLILSGKVSQCTELLEAQNVGNALYGLRGMNSDYREVRAIVNSLTPKIATAREDLNGQALGNSLYGLQSMSSKEPEVRCLLAVLATKVTRTWEELKAQEVGNALYGLKRMSTDVPEVRILISSLVPKVASSPEILDAQAIGNSFYGLQNMKSDNPEVLSLLSVMAEKVAISCPELDGQAMGNSLYGLQGMSSECPEVRAVVQALTVKLQSSCLEMNAQEMGNALYGMQNMTSEHVEVRRLISALTQKVSSSKHELTSQEIGNAMFGLQGMNSSVWETRMLVRQMSIKIQQSHSILDPQGVSNSLYGIQRMSSDSEDVRLLVHALAIKIEHSWKLLSGLHISNALFGMQSLCSGEKEVKYLLKVLVPKILSCRDDMNAKNLSYSLFGLRNLNSDDLEVLPLVAAISDKINSSSDNWTLHNLGMTLFGIQGLSTDAEEVCVMLAAIAKKLPTIDREEKADPSIVSNCILGLQRKSSNNADVVSILSLLSDICDGAVSSAKVQNSFFTLPMCANILFGLHLCDIDNEFVGRILTAVLATIRRVTDSSSKYLPSATRQDDIFGQAHVISAQLAVEKFEDILSVYQSLTLFLFSAGDSDDRESDIYHQLLHHSHILLSIIEHRKSEYTPRNLSITESRLLVEVREYLADEPFSVQPQALVDGFEMGLFITLNPNIHLKTSAGEEWVPKLNVEIKGTSFNSPMKSLFYHIRGEYLEKVKGISVELLSVDLFRVESQQGLRYHPNLFDVLMPPPEDLQKFRSYMTSSQGFVSCFNMSSSDSSNGTQRSSNRFPVSRSSSKFHIDIGGFGGYDLSDSAMGLDLGGNNNNFPTNGSSPSSASFEYYDDDYNRLLNTPPSFDNSKKPKAGVLPISSKGKKLFNLLCLGWIGDWPTVTFSAYCPSPSTTAAAYSGSLSNAFNPRHSSNMSMSPTAVHKKLEQQPPDYKNYASPSITRTASLPGDHNSYRGISVQMHEEDNNSSSSSSYLLGTRSLDVSMSHYDDRHHHPMASSPLPRGGAAFNPKPRASSLTLSQQGSPDNGEEQHNFDDHHDTNANNDDDSDDKDTEIAMLEAQLEVARLEAKIKALKNSKMQRPNKASSVTGSSPVPASASYQQQQQYHSSLND